MHQTGYNLQQKEMAHSWVTSQVCDTRLEWLWITPTQQKCTIQSSIQITLGEGPHQVLFLRNFFCYWV